MKSDIKLLAENYVPAAKKQARKFETAYLTVTMANARMDKAKGKYTALGKKIQSIGR